MKHPLRQPLRNLLPVELDEMPVPMRRSLERMERCARRRKLIGKLLAVPYYAAMLCLLVVTAAAIAMALDRSPPLTATDTIATPVVMAGGKLELNIQVDRRRVCRSRIRFMIFDGEGKLTTLELPWAEAMGVVGVDKAFTRTITLARDASPGPARLRIERSFRCPNNVLHELWPITSVEPDIPFTIASSSTLEAR